MAFSLKETCAVLANTPLVIRQLLGGLTESWTEDNEGNGTWNAKEIVAHLAFGEKTDWLVRAKLILSDQPDKTFVPFDRSGHIQAALTSTLAELLDDFESLRVENLAGLHSLHLDAGKLSRKGIHPELGEVTLRELLASWAVHDLGHLAQTSRVLAKHYQNEVGPWKQYLAVLNR